MALPANSMQKAQKWVFRTGMWLTIVCACLTAMAGYNFGGGGFKSVLFAALFAGITFGAALILPFIGQAASRGFAGTAAFMAVAWLCFTAGEFASHLMVFAGHRHSDIQAADLKTVSFDDYGKNKADAEDKLNRAQRNLDDLMAANPWFATVSAQGLEESLRTKTEEIRQEESRGGCKSKCLARKKEHAALADQLGKLKAKSEYELALEDAKAKATDARKVVASSSKGDSVAMHQSNVFGALIFADLRPDADQRDWANLYIEFFIALLLTIGPMSLVFAGLKDWDAPKRQRKSLMAWMLTKAAWIAALFGKELPSVKIEHNQYGTMNGISKSDWNNARLAAGLV